MLSSILISAVMAEELSGFTELRLQAYSGVASDLPFTVVERLRPSWTGELSDRLLLTATIEAGLSQGWRAETAVQEWAEAEGLSPALLEPLAFEEAGNELLQISSAGDYLAVDRLYLEYLGSGVDLRLGRQAMNWGSGFLVNPSDPFPEVLLTEPWKPRSGINALRVDLPFGDLNALQLVAGSDDAFLHPRLAGRVTVNALETDWSLVGAWREEIEEGIVGLDIKGTLGVGFWLEGVAHLRQGEEAYEELVAGLDYSLPVLEQLILTAQYYRNGAGSQTAEMRSLMEGEPESFAPLFAGRDYLIASVMLGLTPEWSLSTLWMQNLNDASAFVVPSLSSLLGQRFELSLAAQLPTATSGAGGEFKPPPEDLLLELPAEEGGLVAVDLGDLVPEATFILWTRYNF